MEFYLHTFTYQLILCSKQYVIGVILLLSREEFTRISLEINLFFQRIMKEHLFFIETNLQPVEADNIAKAKFYKQSFEQLLSETVYYANGVVSELSIHSNEFVTPYTLRAEEVNAKLTGAGINTEITKAEMNLVYSSNYYCENWPENIAYDINARSLCLLDEVIAFQKNLMSLQMECKIFITLYPEMLEHDTREAMYYLAILKMLQNKELPRITLCNELNFWNNIMGEHAQFMDGMLDPTERSLKKTAENTAEKFEKLVEECIRVSENQILQRSLDATASIQNFKQSATEGLLECKIKSIIPPLLADHVLREANHYLMLLRLIKR